MLGNVRCRHIRVFYQHRLYLSPLGSILSRLASTLEQPHAYNPASFKTLLIHENVGLEGFDVRGVLLFPIVPAE